LRIEKVCKNLSDKKVEDYKVWKVFSFNFFIQW
jgi:hypothetical protein